MLIIEDDSATTYDLTKGQTFRLNLTNAEWIFDYADSQNAEIEGINEVVGVGDGYEIEVSRRTDTSVTVTIVKSPEEAGKSMRIPMLAELDGEGEARVTIDPMNSKVTGGTYTFAVGVSGETTAFVDDVETISRGRNQKTGSIIIDEVTAGSLGGTSEKPKEHGFRLRLPSDFHWEDDTVVRFEGLNVSGVSGTTGELDFKTDGRDCHWNQ